MFFGDVTYSSVFPDDPAERQPTAQIELYHCREGLACNHSDLQKMELSVFSYHTLIIKCTKPRREPFHLCPLLILSTVLTPFKWPLLSHETVIPQERGHLRCLKGLCLHLHTPGHGSPVLPSNTPVRAEFVGVSSAQQTPLLTRALTPTRAGKLF